MKIHISLCAGGTSRPLDAFEAALLRYLEGDVLNEKHVNILLDGCERATPLHGPWYRFVACSKTVKPGGTLKLKARALVSVSDNADAAVYAGSSYNHDMDKESEAYALVKLDKIDVLLSHGEMYRLLREIGTPASHALQRLTREHETLAPISSPVSAEVFKVFDADWPLKVSNWNHLKSR